MATENPLSEGKVKPSIFLICPDGDEQNPINILTEEYAAKKGKDGYHVCYPRYDINPIDPTDGIRTCEDIRQAIEKAGAIHLWYGPSLKLRFEMGIAFVSTITNPGKKIILANKEKNFIRPIPSECFGFDINRDVTFFSNSYQTLEAYRKMGVVKLQLDLSEQFPFNFGVAFGLRKPILITNPKGIRPMDNNDFNKVLMVLGQQTREEN